MRMLYCAKPGCSEKIFEFNDEAAEWLELGGNHYCPAHLDGAAVTDSHDARGFTEPEDGAGERYRTRRSERPWIQHTFWWIVHNVVAHPMIGLFPLRICFAFHDWTSRRMHGRE